MQSRVAINKLSSIRKSEMAFNLRYGLYPRIKVHLEVVALMVANFATLYPSSSRFLVFHCCKYLNVDEKLN